MWRRTKRWVCVVLLEGHKWVPTSASETALVERCARSWCGYVQALLMPPQ